MFCHNCGKQLPDGAKFCTACGTAQIPPAAADQPAEERTAPQAPPPPPPPAPDAPPASAGGFIAAMRGQSVRSAVVPFLFGLAAMAILFAAGGPALGLSAGAVIAILCAIPLIKALSGSYQKEALELLRAENCAPQAERFFAATSPVQSVYMGRSFVYFQQRYKSVLLRPWDVAWVYHHVTRRYALFIPMGSSHSVIIRTMAGKSYERFIPKQECQPFLEAVQAALPGAVVGYSAQLEQAYQSDRKAFAARWEKAVPGCTAGHTFR